MSHGPVGRRESSDDRQQAIAKAACELIIEKGFEGLRTRDIAERVGINVATLHYHVPTKDELVTLVAQSIRQQFEQQSARRPRANSPPRERFRLELDDFRETMSETPDLVSLMVELGQRARRDATVDTVMRSLHGHWVGQFIEIFREGVADGTFRADLDPKAAAVIVTGTLSDFWRQPRSSVDCLDAITREFERAFLTLPLLPKD